MTKKQIATAVIAGIMAMGAGAMVASLTTNTQEPVQVQQVAQVETKAQAVEQKAQKVEINKEDTDKIHKAAEGTEELTSVLNSVSELRPGMDMRKVADIVGKGGKFIVGTAESGNSVDYEATIYYKNYQVTLNFENGMLYRVDNLDAAKKSAAAKAIKSNHPVTVKSANKIQKNMSPEDVKHVLGCNGVVSLWTASPLGVITHVVWYTTDGQLIRVCFENNKVTGLQYLDNHYDRNVAMAHNNI